MNWLKFLFTNPFSIATTVVHHLVVIYSIIFEETGLFSSSPPSFPYNAPVFEWLGTLNYLSILILNIVGNFLDYVIGLDLPLNILLGIVLFTLVTFQWMLVGYLISRFFNLSNK